MRLYTLDDINYWYDDFESTLDKIKNSNDRYKNNYTAKNFDIFKQEDMSVIYVKDKLVAFSSVFSSPVYPVNTYRILNRFWKDDLVRWDGYVSITMLRHQLDVLNELNADCGFISAQGYRKRWMQNWIDRAIAKGFDFKQVDGMVKVCNGSYKNCWHNVGYILNREMVPSFEIMGYDEWKLNIQKS